MTTNLFFKNLSDLVKKLNESRESENGSYIKSNKSSEYNSKSLDGAIKRFLGRRSFDYLFTEPATNPSRRSSINWEKAMLLLETEDELRRRDPKRAILGSAPFARYILRNLINSQEIDLTFLSDTNPLRIKYGNKFSPRNPWDKFEFLRDYTNENSFSTDSAHIGGMTGATDFLQLYKVTSELIQSPEDKEKIIESVFEILKSKDPDDFYDRYEALKRALENANKNMEDFKLTRLYNRLWHIFSFFLNSLYPGVFPIYFPDTRAVCDKHGIDGYGGIAHAFSDFKEKHKEIIEKYIKRLGIYDIESIEGAYLMKKDVLSKLFIGNDYQDISPNDLSIKFLKEHAQYRCFQDILWMYNLPREDIWNYMLDDLGFQANQVRPEYISPGKGPIRRYDFMIMKKDSEDPFVFVETRIITDSSGKVYELIEEQIEQLAEPLKGVLGGYVFLTDKDGKLKEKVFYRVNKDGRMIPEKDIPTHNDLVKEV